MIRRSSSMARALAVPALNIACESARMTLFMVCASSPVEQKYALPNPASLLSRAGSCLTWGESILPSFGYRQTPSKIVGILPLGAVEIIHRTFVTLFAQGYLHLSNTPNLEYPPS